MILSIYNIKKDVFKMKKLSGITVAMTTPFTKDNQVDYAAMAKQTKFLVKKGVDCLYPCGTTGEMLRLSLEERKKIMDTVLEAAGGKVVVYFHCGAVNEEETIELCKYAEKIGADGIGVVTPQFFGLNHREMVEFYVRVANSVKKSFPVYLYNIPQCAANDITVAEAAEIAERCPNIVGLKYSWADIGRTMDYLGIRDGKFSVMHGNDRHLIAWAALGCDGTVSGISGVFPEPFVKVWKCIKEGKWDQARKYQRQAAEITDILHAGANMAYFKAALEYRGLDGGHMRAPQLDLLPADVKALQKDIDAFCKKYGYKVKG